MNSFVTVTTFTFNLLACLWFESMPDLKAGMKENKILPNLRSVDTLDFDLSGDFYVCNFRVSGNDTFYHYYAGTSNSCMDYDPLMPMGKDSIYDRINIREIEWFQYRYNEDSLVTVDSKKEKRKYYAWTWSCQKGRCYFYRENDTLYKLNAYRDSSWENYNHLPRWIPVTVQFKGPNVFEVQSSNPPFYPILNHKEQNLVKTVFMRADRSRNESGIELWEKY